MLNANEMSELKKQFSFGVMNLSQQIHKINYPYFLFAFKGVALKKDHNKFVHNL